jgi:SAM-dependent methyltransferase
VRRAPAAKKRCRRVLINANNPHHRGAGLYELNLALPLISRIRRQEARAVANLIERHAHGSRTALEVGPGTGFYTVMLARAFREVVAVEDSPRMAEILKRKLAAAEVRNVTVVNHDFRAVALDDRFDVAMAIGVLDYVADPARFVAKMCAAAQRAVILTAPQRGMWGACFAAAGRLRKTAVYCHDRCAPSAWVPGWRCSVTEVGLNSRLTRGLTLVVALEPAQVDVSVRTP